MWVDVIKAGTPSGRAERASDIQVGDQALSIRTAVFSDNGPVTGLDDKVHALANDLAKNSPCICVVTNRQKLVTKR